MKIPLVHNWKEGAPCALGVNWYHNQHGTAAVLYLYLFFVVFRIKPKGFEKRLTFRVRWRHRVSSCGVTINFESDSITINGVTIAICFLEDIANPNPDWSYKFKRVGDQLEITKMSDHWK